MSILDWLKRIFGLRVARDITRLDPSSTSSRDAKQEYVDVSGGPLHPHSKRRAIRDGRLLPKSKLAVATRWIRKKPRLFTASEAQRLFGGTMRTRNRNLRDLKTDEDQLLRYGLPLWYSEADVAEAVGVSEKELRSYSIHREAAKTTHYVTFRIPKRSGGTRLIMAPKRKLKAIQREIDMQLASRLPVSEQAHGFVAERNIVTGAEPHVGKRVVVRADLADFFPSVTFPRVRGLLIGYGYSYPVATGLAVLMTECERQRTEVDGTIFHVPVGPRHCVQGAPTSPAICNAIAAKLDRRLNGLATKIGFVYTRYADDLTFSGDDDAAVSRLMTLVRRIVEDEGFRLNDKKTRVMRRGTSQRVTNVTVNDVVGMSRQERRKLRATIHGASERTMNRRDYETLRGRITFVSMLNTAQAEPLWRAFNDLREPAAE